MKYNKQAEINEIKKRIEIYEAGILEAKKDNLQDQINYYEVAIGGLELQLNRLID